MTEPKRHDVPLEQPLEPQGRTGEGLERILPHLQQQVQVSLPPELNRPSDASTDITEK